MTTYIREAFDKVCEDAREPEGAYVCLMERTPFYGGPEEGGWWGCDTDVVEYKWFSTTEEAESVRAKVDELAEEFKAESVRSHGEHCLREMEWLEARGLDADYLPEPDGPSDYYVTVADKVPTGRSGCRHYE